ncbi:MAG: SCO7613 C-terminal domain-containing membrane protein, partial [Aquihabitans sp.]
LTAATVADTLLGQLLTDTDVDPHLVATGGSLAAASLLAGYLAWLRAESTEIRSIALFVATALGLASVGFGSIDAVGSQTMLGLVALAASVVLLVGRRIPRAWGDAPSITAGAIGLLAVLPLVGAVASMLVAASTVSAETWHRSGATVAADLQIEEASTYGSLALALQLAAVAVAIVALVRRGARVAIATSLAVIVAMALTLSPLLAPLTITTTVVIALVAVLLGVGLAAAVGARSPIFAVATGFAVVAYAWATPWSLATPGLTLLTLGTGIVGAAVVAVVARRSQASAAAAGATAWVVAAMPLFVGLAAWDGGASTAMAWAAGATASAVLSIVAFVLFDPSGDAPEASRTMGRAAEATALAGYLLGLLGAVCAAEPNAASVALAAGVVGFGLQVQRPGRWGAGIVAAVELLALVWLQLGQAEVVLVEAYTLPLAVVLLGAGLLGARMHHGDGRALPSWITYGPALVVAFAPTVWLSFDQPGSLRPLIGLVAGALVLIGGAVWGKRALVDVGAAAVIALGFQQIAPVVGEVPNWAIIGATGILLLAVGATFEQRRRDLKSVLRSYAALT